MGLGEGSSGCGESMWGWQLGRNSKHRDEAPRALGMDACSRGGQALCLHFTPIGPHSHRRGAPHLLNIVGEAPGLGAGGVGTENPSQVSAACGRKGRGHPSKTIPECSA